MLKANGLCLCVTITAESPPCQLALSSCTCETINGAGNEVSNVHRQLTKKEMHLFNKPMYQVCPNSKVCKRKIAMQQPFIGSLVRARSIDRREQRSCVDCSHVHPLYNYSTAAMNKLGVGV